VIEGLNKLWDATTPQAQAERTVKIVNRVEEQLTESQYKTAIKQPQFTDRNEKFYQLCGVEAVPQNDGGKRWKKQQGTTMLKRTVTWAIQHLLGDNPEAAKAFVDMMTGKMPPETTEKQPPQARKAKGSNRRGAVESAETNEEETKDGSTDSSKDRSMDESEDESGEEDKAKDEPLGRGHRVGNKPDRLGKNVYDQDKNRSQKGGEPKPTQCSCLGGYACPLHAKRGKPGKDTKPDEDIEELRRRAELAAKLKATAKPPGDPDVTPQDASCSDYKPIRKRSPAEGDTEDTSIPAKRDREASQGAWKSKEKTETWTSTCVTPHR
jgi:hypothetical protein